MGTRKPLQWAARAVVASLVATTMAACAFAGSSRSQTVLGLNVLSWEDVQQAETTLGHTTGIVSVFRDFASHPDFPVTEARAAVDQGSTLMIAWEPWESERGTQEQPDMSPDRVLAGNFDPLIDSWAGAAAAFADPVMIRFAPEMNGDWRPWSPGVVGGTSQDYIDMWRYVVGRFEAADATNVRWVWNPYVESGESTPMADLYPGDDYVDYVAVDGFNWGSVRDWGWQSYDDIFASSVDQLGVVAPDKPWLIAEVGCAPGSAKAEWTEELLTRANEDGAVAVVWFEVDKETDWRITADSESTRVVSSLLSESSWLAGADLERDW